MKDRIYQLMTEQGMNQKEFAIATGISPTTLSNIFGGRTAPTLNNARAILNHYPDISTDWLIFGNGPQRKDADSSVLHTDTPPLYVSSTNPDEEPYFEHETKREIIKYMDRPQRKIVEIRVFFDDGTYDTFPASR